jgi:hypothetical protein
MDLYTRLHASMVGTTKCGTTSLNVANIGGGGTGWREPFGNQSTEVQRDMLLLRANLSLFIHFLSVCHHARSLSYVMVQYGLETSWSKPSTEKDQTRISVVSDCI